MLTIDARVFGIYGMDQKEYPCSFYGFLSFMQELGRPGCWERNKGLF